MRRAAWVAPLGLALGGLVLIGAFARPGANPGDAGDYGAELARLRSDIAAARGSTADVEDPRKLALLLFRRASLTGATADFAEADGAITAALERGAQPDPLYVLRTMLDLNQHRVAAAREGIARVAERAAGPELLELRGDLAVQLGRDDDARRDYDRLLHTQRTWGALARLAYLDLLAGDVSGADRRYGEAEAEVSAKEMRAYAWLELQRGYLAFSRGRYDGALEHYRTAARAYSGYWLVDEYTAELLGAQQKFEEAAALYRAVVARTPRPEIHHALGDLYALMGNAAEAAHWHEEALAGYLASVGRGEVLYVHHLAAFYADVAQDGAAAVEWARRDFEMRQTAATRDTLAWALYRRGDYGEALTAIYDALAPGGEDAHVLLHAGMIALAAGRMDEGRRFLDRAAAVNPYLARFHEHR